MKCRVLHNYRKYYKDNDVKFVKIKILQFEIDTILGTFDEGKKVKNGEMLREFEAFRKE